MMRNLKAVLGPALQNASMLQQLRFLNVHEYQVRIPLTYTL